MILTCPACQTQYIVPEDALGTKARTVKCANCGYSWKQEPIAVTEIDLSAPTAPSYSDAETTATSDTLSSAADMAQNLRWQQALHADVHDIHFDKISTTRFIVKTVAWLIVLLVFTAICLAYARHTLSRVWPASTLLYETLGFPTPAAGTGLKFKDDVTASLLTSSIPHRLRIAGHFTNTKPYAVPLPILQARLFNDTGIWLKDWAIPLESVGFVGGKGTMTFDYTLPQVPAEAHRLTFRFVDE